MVNWNCFDNAVKYEDAVIDLFQMDNKEIYQPIIVVKYDIAKKLNWKMFSFQFDQLADTL